MSKKTSTDLSQTRLDDLFADLESEAASPQAVSAELSAPESSSFGPVDSRVASTDQMGSDGARKLNEPVLDPSMHPLPALAGWTWECDGQGRYTNCSAEIQAALGHMPEDFIGQSLLSHGLTPQSKSQLQAALKQGIFPISLTLQFFHRHGSPQTVTFNVLPPPSEGSHNGRSHGLRGFAQLVAEQTAPAVISNQPTMERGSSPEHHDLDLLLRMLDDDPQRQWSPEERALVEQVSDQLSLALENARLFQRNVELLEEVEQDRQRYSDLYNRAPDCYFSTDPSGKFLEFNLTGLTWLRFSREEVVGRFEIIDILAPYSRPQFTAHFSRLHHEGRLDNIEVDFLRKDGTTFPVLLDATALYDTDGSLLQCRAIARDVSRLRQLELRQRQLARAIEATADMVIITDQAGTILFANPATELVTGYAREEVIGKNPRLLKSGKQEHNFYENMWTTILAGQVWRGEVVNRRKNGSLFNAQLTISPISNERGEIAQFVAVQRDITAQKHAEAEREKLLVDTEILYKASAELNATQSYDEILHTLRRHTLVGHGAHHINIATFDHPWTSTLVPEWIEVVARWAQNPAVAFESRHAMQALPALARLLRSDSPLVIDDITHDPRLDDSTRSLLAKRYGAASAIFIPLVVSNRWIGYINANYPQTNYFPAEEIRRLMVLAGQAAVAFQNIRLLEETRVRNEELTTLNAIISTASRSLDPSAMLTDVLNQLLAIVDFQAGLISVIDPRTKRLRLAVQRNLPAALSHRIETSGLEGTLCDHVFQRGETLHIANFQEGAPLDVSALIDMGLRSYLGVPLVSKGKILGTVCVFGQHPQTGSLTNLALLQSVGQQVGVAIENATLFEETQAALAETENLYQSSARLNAARSFTEILSALRISTILGHSDQPAAALVAFDKPWYHGQPPQNMEILALWTPQQAPLTIPRRMPLAPFKWLLENFRPDAPLSLEGFSGDSKVDEFSLDWAKRSGFKSAILIPLVAAGQWLGFVGGFYSQPTQFPEAERRILMSLAGQAAVAVQNLQNLDLAESRAHEAQRRSNELALINRTISAVSSSLDLRSSLDVIARQLGEALSVQTGIALLNEERQVLTVTASYTTLPDASNVIGIDLPLEGNPSSQEVISTGQTLIIEDAQHNPLTASIQDVMVQRGIQTLMIIPIVAGNKVIGTVGLDILQPGRSFQTEEVTLAETIVLQAATAIQNARLFEQTEEALAETEALYRASAELNVATSFEDILATLRKHSLLGEGTRLVSIDLFDLPWSSSLPPEKTTPICRWAIDGDLAHWLADFPTPLVEMRSLLKSDSIVVVDNPAEDERLSAPARQLYLDEYKAGSLLFAPVVVAGEWIGHLVAVYAHPLQLGEKELRRLLTLIGQAAVAIQNIRLLQESRRQAEQLQTAAEIARDASSTLALDTLLDRAASLIREGFDYYQVSIFMLDEAGKHAVVRASAGEAKDELKQRGHQLAVGSRSVIGFVTSSGQSLVVKDVLEDAIHRPNPLLPLTRSELGIPMKIGDRVIGALDLQSVQVNAFTKDDISVLQILADQIAVAVDNARAYSFSQQAVEEMRKADQLKSQFLANMSHELRTPLNSIIGFSRVIIKGIDGPVTDLQQQDLTAIYNSGQHLLNLINDILDLSKIEAGKMELTFEDNVNLADIISSVMSTVVGLIKDKPIQIVKEIAPDLPGVRADPLKIRQILINLFSNAAKFTDQGFITIKAQSQVGPQGSLEVLISVMDTGPGIAPQDQARLFLPFSQVDGSPTRKTGGSGLGLSICRHLVEMHHGRIGLDSQAGTGSTFYFTLPTNASLVRGTGELNLDLPLVLAIDDDQQILKLYNRYLRTHGFQVLGLTDPTIAVETARQYKPYAITLDIMMPGTDGWQVLQQLKSDPETRKIPIILCTILEEQGKGFSLGATDYLMKPILEEDLVEALQRINHDGSLSEILVIDDDPDDRGMIQKIFAGHSNLRLHMAESGHQALTAIHTHPPHLIILDLFMPDLDGFTLLETVRADPALADIPVIVLTSGDLDDRQHSRLENFAQAMLQKSHVTESELLLIVEQALNRYHPHPTLPNLQISTE